MAPAPPCRQVECCVASPPSPQTEPLATDSAVFADRPDMQKYLYQEQMAIVECIRDKSKRMAKLAKKVCVLPVSLRGDALA